MKYRIKNERERRLLNDALGITELEATNPKDTLLTIRVSFAGNDWLSFFNTEPIPQLAEGWHPYPEIKPERAGKYLVALKCNDDGERNVVDAATFAENCFDAWHSDSNIFAWKEMPKIWKE